MTIIRLPHEFIKEKELVIIPRREFEELLRMAKKNVPEIEMTPLQKKILLTARKNKKAGNFLTFNELKRKLGITN